MRTKYLLLFALIIAFSSCSTAYRSGQTPDDVYYSPAPARVDYVTTTNQDDRDSYGYRNEEEQEIRRGIQDPRYRTDAGTSITLGLGYGYNPYAISPYSYSPFGYGYNPYSYSPYGYKGIYDPYSYYPSYYGNYYGGNYYGGNYYGYGSYYPPVYVYPGIGRVNTNTGPRKVNLGAFNSATTNSIIRANTPSGSVTNGSSVPVRTFTQKPPQGNTGGRQSSGVGNVIRRVFSPSENRTYTPSNDRSNNETRSVPVRTMDNAPSSNSNSSSSGSAPVRTFRR